MRAILFVHFDRDGIFDPHVVYSLNQYRKLADHLVVISPSAIRLPPELSSIVDTFIHRENQGYDFCSWKAGWESISDVSRFDEMLFINDSVYGPLFDMDPAIHRWSSLEADLFGMVLSEQAPKEMRLQSIPHVQSWFFGFRGPVIQSDSFQQFWNQVEVVGDKSEIIRRYEIGMSTHFQKAGFRIGGLYDARMHNRIQWNEIKNDLSWRTIGRSIRLIKKALRKTYNPSELTWERLIRDGVPFLKVNLLRVNHYGLKTQRVFEQLPKYTDYDLRLIKDHLARVMR